MPVKDKSWYESAYSDVFVRDYDPEKAYILKPDIKIGAPNVREAFNAAAFGIPVFTSEFLTDLIGLPIHFYQTDPNAPPPDNEKIMAIAKPIIKALEKKVLTGSLLEREQQELNTNIQAYIKISGIHPDHINGMIEDIEEKRIPENFQNIIDGEKIFSFLSDSVLSSESRKIIIKLLIDESIAGALQPDKKEQLDQAIQRFAFEENIRITAMDASLEKIREKLKNAPSAVLSIMVDISKEIAKSTGAAHVDTNQKNYRGCTR
jgi:hypothetical protein